jgi:TM2 domain-containing membrane protein YozV
MIGSAEDCRHSNFNSYAVIAKKRLKMAAALSHGFAGVGRFLRKEFVAAWPVFLFFLTGFLLLLVLIKLALAQFSVEMTALSKAFVGALIAAKAALVLDETPVRPALTR